MKSKIKFGIISVLITFGTVSFSSSDNVFAKTHKTEAVSSIETFTFLSHGKKTNGKIYLPASYPSNKNLPVIYLIDFAEQHFKLATDEFEKVIDAVNQVEGFEALVVSLENIPNFNAEPETFKEHYEIFKNMASYVDTKFTKNTSKTLIGRGSESGIVLMTLFIENEDTSVFNNFIATDPSPKYTSALMDLIEKDGVPKKESNKKLHLSFSTTNDQVQCTKLINLIKDANYHWLDFESIEYTESDYENAYPMAYANGIKYVFNK
ncbi:hypothetical protein [Winogradskyella thalassocola]|uniref:Esterase n=1 Tax=Winogradskyella thalassocola TaxID=262004 RepID=A0A1G7WCL6_9FLAO|nr:hypothetical protein [Winogradskyella thalassocola]SDG69712.1 hypothetical protein SAMN04489796_101319 [Winogradskyella thalassocola]